jgi:hypothetical protein
MRAGVEPPVEIPVPFHDVIATPFQAVKPMPFHEPTAASPGPAVKNAANKSETVSLRMLMR